MFRLYVASSVPEAHIVLHMLTEARIEGTVIHENAGGALGELPVTYPEVWISWRRDEARAREIVAEYERTARDPGAPSSCVECGESNPGNFELCWQCQAPLRTG